MVAPAPIQRALMCHDRENTHTRHCSFPQGEVGEEADSAAPHGEPAPVDCVNRVPLEAGEGQLSSTEECGKASPEGTFEVGF